jgi:hypothetical protein
VTSRKLLVFLVSMIITPMQVSAMTFTDVPTTHFAYSFIETFAFAGITSGCTPEEYCPDDPVSRAQMAVFVERGMNGGDYSPPPATGEVFLDVAANSFAAAYIEQFFLDGITGGCGGGNYCPGRSVTRAEMAVFVLRAVFGPDYEPPSATGELFADVAAGDFAAAFIEQFSREGITGGCGGGNYCPDDLVTRAQMAVFLVRAFELTGPTQPQAYWTMEEGAGATTADTVGNSDGTLVGATWTTGVSGSGLEFNGTSDYVVIDNTPALDITGTEITLMAWIYPHDAGLPGDPELASGSRPISKRTDAGGSEVYAMKLEDYRLCFRLAPETSCEYTDHVLVLNEWVHVAMVYDGVDKRIYINGVLDESGPEARTAPIEASSRPVFLGMREGEGRNFNGVLDEVKIYDQALSADEVQAIHGATTAPLPGPGLRFTNITETAGTGGPRVGARGIMFAEVNNDSLPDFYMTSILSGVVKREFYFENINGDSFVEEAVARGIDDPDGSYGAVWADLDNDGDYDLFNGTTWSAANPGPGFPTNNNVYENAGDASGSFADVTSAAILATATETRGVTAFDMDNDGDLDLYGVSGGNTPGANEAYLNGLIGGAGAFDFTSHVGGDLATANAKNGVTDADYDNDGDIDVLAANTTGEFVILQNNGSGTFTQILPSTLGINDPAGSGITPADVDNDGDLDLLLTSQNLQSYLYRREDNGSYVLQQTFINGWMGSFADLDNDGDLDLVFSGDFRSYLNDGSGTFVSGQSLPVSSVVDARAIAFADIDSDGDLDFAVAGKGVNSDPDGRSVLIRNDIGTDAGNWLRVELVSPTCQAGAFGARTRVYAAGDAGGTLLGMRESQGTHGYHAQNEPVLHFGLGSEASVDVVVDFLDGTQTIVEGVAANQRILVDECP